MAFPLHIDSDTRLPHTVIDADRNVTLLYQDGTTITGTLEDLVDYLGRLHSRLENAYSCQQWMAHK